jgi:hypothetical protein
MPSSFAPAAVHSASVVMGTAQCPLRLSMYDAPPALERPGSHATHENVAFWNLPLGQGGAPTTRDVNVRASITAGFQLYCCPTTPTLLCTQIVKLMKSSELQ